MNNLDKYYEYTKTLDWRAICKLNNIDLESFDTKKELNILENYLEEDEVVFALTSGIMTQIGISDTFDFGANAWLVVLTSDRFLFLDCAMLSISVDTQSIRHDRVQAVSSSQGWFLGKIMLDLGSRELVIDNCQNSTVAVIAALSNKWIKEFSEEERSVQLSRARSVSQSADNSSAISYWRW